METIFVSKRSEVTAEIDRLSSNCPPVFRGTSEAEGVVEFYRTRVNCNCRYPHNFRYGALVVCNNVVTHKIVRCKACASQTISPLEEEKREKGGSHE